MFIDHGILSRLYSPQCPTDLHEIALAVAEGVYAVYDTPTDPTPLTLLATPVHKIFCPRNG